MATTYNNIEVDNLNIFYREAGRKDAPTILLLHGFPSSSHMFRDLIPQLAGELHVVAPDYPGFGYSDAPTPAEFSYTFDHLADIVEKFVDAVGLKQFSIFVQDYGAPVGFRLATRRPESITGIITQNGNAYVEGISAAFDPVKPFWENRNAETEIPVRGLLKLEATIFQYTHGTRDPKLINPDSYTFDQHFLNRSGNDLIQLELLHNYPMNIARYPEWHAYFRQHQPPTLAVWGKHDPFFAPAGAESYKRDLPNAEVHLLDTGHFALEDHCEEIANRIIEFLRKHQPSWETTSHV